MKKVHLLNRRMRLFATVLALSISTLALAGCTAEPAAETTPQNQTDTDNESDDFTIGIVQLVEHPALDAAREGFTSRLEDELGDKVSFVVENAQGEQANAVTIAGQFAARDDLDMILAIATSAAEAVVNVITDIPVLFTAVTDAEEAGLVASNEAPGGNVTGTSDLSPIREQFELLQQLVPGVETVGIMYSSSEDNSHIQARQAQEIAEEMGLKVVVNTSPNTNEIQQVVEATASQCDAIWIPTDNGFASAASLVGQVTTQSKTPVITGEANQLLGGLATVGIDYFKLGEQTAAQALQILFEGADPGSIAVETQSDPQLTVNEAFAEAIGLEIPADILERAEKYEPAT